MLKSRPARPGGKKTFVRFWNMSEKIRTYDKPTGVERAFSTSQKGTNKPREILNRPNYRRRLPRNGSREYRFLLHGEHPLHSSVAPVAYLLATTLSVCKIVSLRSSRRLQVKSGSDQIATPSGRVRPAWRRRRHSRGTPVHAHAWKTVPLCYQRHVRRISLTGDAWCTYYCAQR